MRKLLYIFATLFLIAGSRTANGQTISGHLKVCLGASRTTLTIGTTGGTWSSGDVTKATIDPSTGVVTGVAAGTSTISYNVPPSTVYTAVVTVNALTMSIGVSIGTSPTCVGSFTTYTATPTNGNAWSSSNLAVGTITTGGNLAGLSAGTTIISYRHGSGDCYVATTQTVNAIPSVTINTLICAAVSQTGIGAPSGGTWSSSNTGVGTINSTTGVFTGSTAGTTNVSYTATSGCRLLSAVTVVNTPAAITGTTTVCQGSTTTLNSPTASQTWSSSDPSVATVVAADANNGTVTGVSAGTTLISYTNSSGCSRVVTITVTGAMSANTGAALVCLGQTTTLSNATAGGVWSSGNIPVASVNSGSGLVTPASVGNAPITYTITTPASCRTITQVTVNAALGNNTGATAVCLGSNITLSNATSGGTWSSSNANATVVGSTGVVTGVTAGTAVITYAFSTGCFKTTTITINAIPAAITGTFTLCEGTSTTLATTSTGGTWQSSNTAVGTINSSTGVLQGIAAGTTSVSYKFTVTGCQVTQDVTVNPLPSSIAGALTVCKGSTTTLTSATSGGTWSSTNTSVATVGTSGIVTGVNTGNATISYVLGTGCFRTAVVTVNAVPAAIGGSAFLVCEGSTITLTDATSGGTWQSSNTAVATVGSTTGVVSGVAVAGGVSTISYVLSSTGCYAVRDITVNPRPAAITGSLSLCEGSTTLLSTTPSGGTWSSSATSIATVGTGGSVSGVLAGNSNITYTLSTGCLRAATVTVNAVPAAIGGSAFLVCEGSTITLTDATSGGTWQSSNTAVATVGSTTGVVSGVAVAGGVSTISYVLSSTGCYAVRDITVNPRPAAITGSLSLCEGSTTLLSTTPSGGTWSSSATSIATVGTDGTLTGVLAGNSNISYTLSTGCFRSAIVTVNLTPAAIGGSAFTVCEGSTITLTETTTGGTWQSSNTSVATVGSTTGIVTGIAVAGGVSAISYIMPSSGCFAIRDITVNPRPASITGASFVCEGSTITLSSSTSGGTWSSSNAAVATVGTSGVVNGVLAGNATITYTAGGCFRTAVVTVGVTPTTITGTQIICYHQTSTLSSTPSGQTWTSGNTLVATVNPATGVVYGEAVGTAGITYTHSNSCFTTAVVTVSTGPNTGNNIVCVGQTVTLSNATTGGTWSSSNGNVTVNSSTGVVTGITAGAVNITYSVISDGCIAVTAMTVNPAMDTIAGQRFICLGTTSTLTHTSSSGTWSSSNTSVATVDITTGAVFGAGIGTANITYTVSSGCIKTTQVTVNSTLPAINGFAYMCVGGGARQFTHSLGGGIWSSSNTAIATVSGSGLVFPIAPGTVTITYTLVSGCSVTFDILINMLPPSISGPTQICVGQVSGLYSVIGGSATWSSSDVSVATIGSGDGTITGIAPGTTTITYAYYGCYLTRILTVNATPAPITGATSMCAEQTMTFTTSPSGGTWTSTNTSVATVGASTGLVTAVIGGTAIISYIMPSGCNSAISLTVGNTPAELIGDHTMCVGNVAELTTTTTGGTWSSGDNTIATVSASGIVTGIGVGVVGISYTHPVSGCVRVAMTTVNAAIAPNVGNNLICDGGTTTLTNASGGGYWTSNNLFAATVNSSTGLVYAVAPGFANIYYVVSSSCYATTNLTVNPVPAPITGSIIVCQGYTTTLGHPVSGGTWSSNNVAIATVGSTTGIVTGVGLGPVAITYTTSSGCFRTITVNVAVVPAPISGSGSICAGSTTSLSTIVGSSGTWSSSDTTIATVNTFGTVTGLAVGNATISYTTASSSCFVTKEVTVNLAADPITGNTYICPGSIDSSFTCSPSGGAWSSSNTSVATINATTGILTAVNAGATSISYTLPSGCRSIKAVTINAAPSTITGTLTVCVGSTTALGSATTGATWSSSNTAVATVSASGVVSGLTPGTTIISYTNASGCANSAVVTVNNVPAAISGNLSLCMGSISMLTNAAAGGTWSSSNTAKATVGVSTGQVTSVATGTANITYTVPGMGCYTVAQVTVNSALAAITGTLNVCIGTTTTLSHSSTGGAWSSSDTTKATVNSASGVVTGIAAGTITMTYSMSSACYKTATFTVKALPVISGTASVCAASSVTLTSSPAGGVWTSSNVTKATISATSGSVTGVDAGTTLISYLTGGCYGTRTVTVNPRPDSVTGTTGLCIASSTTLIGYPSGGTWVSSTVAKATVGTSTGILTGVAAGTSTISYTLSTGCRRTTIVTVGTTPNVITGTTNVCVGSVTTLSSTTTGGTWSSSDAAVATTGTATATSTVVTGIATGSALISYTALGCSRTATVNVSPAPADIVGDTTMCVGSVTTMTSATTGGKWSSSNASIASIGSTTGIANAVAAGTSTISYKTSATCYTSKQVTVNSSLSAITGSSNACVGYTTTLSHPVSGGVWSSSNTARATVDPTTGIVTGIANGSVVITYSFSAGCYKTFTINVNNLPPAITGTALFCELTVTTLTSVTGGSGTWSTANPSIATVASTTGVVTGTGGGTTNITYTATTGCFVFKEVTVNPAPVFISGSPTVCAGSLDTLSNTTPDGVWSSSNTTAATIGSTSGIVSAISGGNSVISYTLPTGCRRTMVLTVNLLPAAISGPGIVCVGNSITLSSATAGQTWSSSNTSVATVGSLTSTTGLVAGVTVGSVTISYTNTFGCSRTYNVTVNSSLPANTGDNVVCVGQTVTLSNSVSGGTWNSSNTAKATVGAATGIVTGVATGSATITYNVGSGCTSISLISVNAVPVSITGTTNVCVGETTTLTHEVSGGTWVSGNTAKATVDGVSGVVTGVSAGTVTITYYVSSGCYKTTIVTVKALPAAITGSICLGANTTLTSASGGGTWSSSNTAVATIGSTSGVANGVNTGTTTISYRVTSTGCSTTRLMTVSTAPAAPTVTPSAAIICLGNSAMLVASGSYSGSVTYTWSPATGLYNNSGMTAAYASGSNRDSVYAYFTVAGTTPVTHTHTLTVNVGGCTSTTPVTVTYYPTLPAISGPTSVCPGSAISLTNSLSGGTWSSSAAEVATVSASGVVTGVTPGSVVITYFATSGCYVTRMVNVSTPSDPGTITGMSTYTVGDTAILSSTTAGGSWSSSAPAVATISGSGLVTGVSLGSAVMSYTVGGACPATGTYAISVVSSGPEACFPVYTDASGSCTLYVTYIKDFSIYTMSDTGTSCDGTGYQNRIGIATVPSLQVGLGYAGVISTGSVNPMKGQMWVDFNDDDYFAPEETIGGISSAFVDTTEFSVFIPDTAATGVHNMRVRIGYVSTTPDYPSIPSCDDLIYGEAHDYLVNIVNILPKPGVHATANTTFSVLPNPTTGVLTLKSEVSGDASLYTIDGRELIKYNVIYGSKTISLPSELAAGVYMLRFKGADGSTQVTRLVYKP